MLATNLKYTFEKEREEGLREGIEKGRQEGRRNLVEKLLQLKFGPLPAWAQI